MNRKSCPKKSKTGENILSGSEISADSLKCISLATMRLLLNHTLKDLFHICIQLVPQRTDILKTPPPKVERKNLIIMIARGKYFVHQKVQTKVLIQVAAHNSWRTCEGKKPFLRIFSNLKLLQMYTSAWNRSIT